MEDSSSKLLVVGPEDDKGIFLTPEKMYTKMFMSQTGISQPSLNPTTNKKRAGGLTSSTCNSSSPLKNTICSRFVVFLRFLVCLCIFSDHKN